MERERYLIAYNKAIGYRPQFSKLEVKYISVFRVVSPLLDLWENFCVGYFDEKANLKYVCPAPTFRSMDGEYRAMLFDWEILYEGTKEFDHIQNLLRIWLKENKVSFEFDLFTEKDNPITQKIKKDAQDSNLSIDLLAKYCAYYFLTTREVFYPFVNNYNTRLFADLINTDYLYKLPEDKQAYLKTRQTYCEAEVIFDNMDFTTGQKSIPIGLADKSALNELMILHFTNWLKANENIVNIPTYVQNSVFSGINENYFMNDSLRTKYTLGTVSNKVLIIYMNNIVSAQTVYFYLNNFKIINERGSGVNQIDPRPEDFNYYIFDWIYTLTSLHLNADIVHLDLHLNNIVIGRSPLRLFQLLANKDIIDAGVRYVISPEITLFLPIIMASGYIIDFSRAVYMEKWEKAYKRIVEKIPETKYLEVEEAKTIARFYDFEMLITNVIEGMRSVVVGRTKTIFDKMPKKVREKLLTLRKTIENMKKEYLEEDSELPRELYPGWEILKTQFPEWTRAYRMKKLDIKLNLELNTKQKIKFEKLRKKLSNYTLDDFIN